MPEIANAVPVGLEETRQAPAALPAGGEWTSLDNVDYVIPPPRNVTTLAVRYGEARKGMPLPYDLSDADAEP